MFTVNVGPQQFELELLLEPLVPVEADGIEYVDGPVLIAAPGAVTQALDGLEIQGLPTNDKVVRSTEAIRNLLEDGRPLAVAYSAGKDSSVMLALVLNAAVEAKNDGVELPPILITHANTGIDNPAYQIVAEAEIRRVRKFIEDHALPARVDVVQPALNDSWAVRVISGRALPTFANSSTRDCSVIWKVKPQERQRKGALAALSAEGDPVVLVGTRFEESDSRAARMAERGEADFDVWKAEVRDKAGKLIRVESRLSPLAWWTQEDVWVYLRDLMDGQRQSYTDATAVWEAYQDGGNSSCAVVADDAMKASAKACGARFGCVLCTAVGRDHSLENMLEADPKYGYLKHLNHLQRFLVDTQYDLTRRNWLGRTIDADGFVRIGPDTYSPEMLKELLRYSLSIDKQEQRAAARLGIRPRFELVSLRQMIAIDAVWACQGIFPKPFEALRIWQDVYEEGATYLPPEVSTAGQPAKMPAPRYLYVGTDFDNDRAVGPYTGLRDLVGELIGAHESGGCVGVRELSDGRLVMDMATSDMFDIDEEAVHDFLQFEVDDGKLLERYADVEDCTEAYRYYIRLGLISTTPQHVGTIDQMLRRTSWKQRHGLIGMSTGELLGLSISAEERRLGQKAPAGQLTLPEEYEREVERMHEQRIGRRPSCSSL